MNTSRKTYRRTLQVRSLALLVMLGIVAAIVGGAFVVVKNRQHSLAKQRGVIESEIASITKQIETLDLRIAAMIDRDAIAARIQDLNVNLVKIERAEKVISGGEAEERFAAYRRPRSADEEF